MSSNSKNLCDCNVLTIANLVTGIRAVGCTIMLLIAFIHGNPMLNFYTLILHWSFDVLDGWLARILHQETLFGAYFDIYADRLFVSLFCINLLVFRPELMAPMIVFLVQFVGLDLHLSTRFARWNIISPNYFYKVDNVTWWLNWSAPAKITNAGLALFLSILPTNLSLLTFGMLILTGIKIYSSIRVHNLAKKRANGRVQPRCGAQQRNVGCNPVLGRRGHR